MARPTTRQVTFADLELALQGVQLDPTLQAICDLLDQNREVLERVQADLCRGLKNPNKGRHGLTARQVVGALVLMRMKNWDYRELRERIADGVTLRQFTDFHYDKVPKHDAFNRGINRLTPETLRYINEAFVGVAVELGLEDGSKLRVGTTVVETDIHHPTDNTLLWAIPTSELPT
jgi:transposase, IS5 family